MISNKDVKLTAPVQKVNFNSDSYPMRANRYYNPWGAQACYNEEEVSLLQRIRTLYAPLEEKPETFFALTQETRLWDMWVCQRPADSIMRQDSFTLAAREAKDASNFPLWNYADSMSRQIANWRSDRIKGQVVELMYDPTMLAFRELEDWFSNSLSEQACTDSGLQVIEKRDSYITHLSHLIPSFGPDKLHLREISQSLEGARRALSNCIANKALPRLLSDLITKAKSLESQIGTYLHFLFINEEVSANFSPAQISPDIKVCRHSALCKIYKDAYTSHASDLVLGNYQRLNVFYDFAKIAEENNVITTQVSLRTGLKKSASFASVIPEEIKNNYIETIATLEAIANVRRAFENFETVLARIGTYSFAMSYLGQVDVLATNYINLISKVNLLTNRLLTAASDGLNEVLEHPEDISNAVFVKNLRSLETQVAKETTVNAQLTIYCQRATVSITAYQNEMRNLVRAVNSGEAKQELEHDMQNLFLQINNLNAVLPGMLGKNNLRLASKPKIELIEAAEVADEPSFLPEDVEQEPQIETGFFGSVSSGFQHAQHWLATGIQNINPGAAATLCLADKIQPLAQKGLRDGTSTILAMLGGQEAASQPGLPAGSALPSGQESFSDQDMMFNLPMIAAVFLAILAFGYLRKHMFSNATPPPEQSNEPHKRHRSMHKNSRKYSYFRPDKTAKPSLKSPEQQSRSRPS